MTRVAAKAIIEIAASVPAITYIKEETLPSGPAITALRAAAIPNVRGVFGGGGGCSHSEYPGTEEVMHVEGASQLSVRGGHQQRIDAVALH